jgi:predicted secreted protein
MNLGEAYVTIEARMTKLEKDLDKVRLLTKKTADASEGSWRKSAHSMEKYMGGAFSRLTRMVTSFAAAYIGIRGIVSFFRASVTEARNAYVVEKALAATLYQRRLYSKDIMEYYRSIANQVQKVSNFDDESVKSAQRIFTMFKVMPRQMAAATAAAANFAAATGQGIEGAAMMLGRAPQFPAMLSRYGIKTNRKDFGSIFGAVNQKFGGQATANQDPFTKFTNILADFKETVGMKLLPPLTDAMKKIGDFLSSQKGIDFANNMGKLAVALLGATAWAANQAVKGTEAAAAVKEIVSRTFSNKGQAIRNDVMRDQINGNTKLEQIRVLLELQNKMAERAYGSFGM